MDSGEFDVLVVMIPSEDFEKIVSQVDSWDTLGIRVDYNTGGDIIHQAAMADYSID